MGKKSLKFTFPNGRGQTLAGLLDLPDGEPRFFGLFAPCFTCTKESHAAHKICRALGEDGIAMLRFDITGIGGSEGNFAETNFTTHVQDIIAAYQAIAAAHEAPKFIIGHSIGGPAAISASRHLPDLAALATLGSPRDPAAVIEKFRRNNQIVIRDDMAELMVMGRKVMVKKTFMDDLLAQHVAQDTAAFKGKLFIFHAQQDNIVHFDNAQAIFDRATCDKELIPLSGFATHLLEQGDEDARFVAETISVWFQSRFG
jgi:putative redox protein